MTRSIKPRSLIAAAFASALLSLATLAHSVDLVLPSEVPATHWKTRYMNEFADEVKKRTNGDIVVKVFPAGQLYNDQEAVAALGTGAVHMVWPVNVRLETLDPRIGYVSLPFNLSDEKMLNRCFRNGVTQMVSSFVEPRNLKVLAFLRTSDALFTFRNKDIKRLDDLKGSKIRVTGGKVYLDMIRSFNASPISMAASEMSTALSQGAIDGIFTSPAGWAEIVGMTGKYAWHAPGMALSTYAVLVDKPWFEKLPANHRKVIVEVVDELGEREWNDSIAEDKKLIAKMIAQGAVYRVADKAEMEHVRAVAGPANKAFADKYPDVTQRMAELEKRCGK